MSRGAAATAQPRLHVATEADAPTERQLIEARLRSHIGQHDQLAADLAAIRSLIAEESRRLSTLDGVTMRPTIDMLRHQLAVGR